MPLERCQNNETWKAFDPYAIAEGHEDLTDFLWYLLAFCKRLKYPMAF